MHCESHSNRSTILKEVCIIECAFIYKNKNKLILLDTVVVKLRCSLNDTVKEHVFSAKKSTLEGLGFANMEEGLHVFVLVCCFYLITYLSVVQKKQGVVEMKDLALLSMHFLVDDMCARSPSLSLLLLLFTFVKTNRKKELVDIDVDLTPEKLNAAFPNYRTVCEFYYII